MQTIDVLVVGAGPVGLVLAAELEAAGVHTVVLEQLAEPDTTQKARGIGVLGSEALRRRGLGTRLLKDDLSGRRDYRHDMGSHHAHFAWIAKLDSAALGGSQTRSGAMIGQQELERLLAEYATGLGVEVRREHRVTGLRQDSTCVRLAVDTPAGSQEYTASHVVGCDGGQSSIRKLGGFEFPGVDATVVTRVARVTPVDPTVFPEPVRSTQGTLQHPGLRDGWVRVRISEPDQISSGQRDCSPVTLAEVQDALKRVTGVDVALADISEGRRVRDNSRQAATYRLGRLMLAGDAAHVHSPVGGQGLNLGIMDAANLGWKLAAVVRGTAHDELLDTYTSERHPVGESVIVNTRAQEALLEPTPQVDALRRIMKDIIDIPQVQAYLGKMMSGVGVRHHLPYAAGAEHELLGRHIPDFVVDNTTLYTIMTDARPLLLYTPPTAAAAETIAAWSDRVKAVSALLLGQQGLAAALIRPDGVLAWAAGPATPPDLTSLKSALRIWFGQPDQDSVDDH